jgi:hypothetical protein
MTRQNYEVLIRPSNPEWDESLDDYREVVAALRDRGIDARLADIPAPPSGSDIPDFLPEAFAVFIAVKVSDAIFATIIEELRRLIIAKAKVKWRPRGEQVKGVVYGPSGSILHEFTFEAEGRDDSPLEQ